MGHIYLIPTFLSEGAVETIPAYVMKAFDDCQVIFAENERTARRFLKAMSGDFQIDNYEWHTIDKNDNGFLDIFRRQVREGKNIAVMSEAGCPGVADPGQELVRIAHEENATVHPLVGPSSILLALMASGLNGQQFEFTGYLPIESSQRQQRIIFLQSSSAKNKSTQVFIETPYRNDTMFQQLLKTLHNETYLCVAIDVTGKNECIKTLPVKKWKQVPAPVMHKIPVIFLLQA